MAMSYRDPFAQFQGELDRMLDAAFGPVGQAATGVFPPVNVFEAGEAYVVKAELPGVAPDTLKVDVEEGTLTLRGERTLAEPGPGAAYHRREREQGQFRRVIRLPGRVAGDEAHAECRDGVLTVRVPKAKETRPRRLTIQAA
jgi:HSP20 family protein